MATDLGPLTCRDLVALRWLLELDGPCEGTHLRRSIDRFFSWRCPLNLPTCEECKVERVVVRDVE